MIYRIVIHLDRPVVDLPTFTVHHPYFLITLHDPPVIHFYSDITHVGSEQHVPAVRARMILLEACDTLSPPAFVGFGKWEPLRNAEYTTASLTERYAAMNFAPLSIEMGQTYRLIIAFGYIQGMPGPHKTNNYIDLVP